MLERLKQYLDYKNITIHAFERSVGMSNASFGKSLKNNGTIRADKLERILNTYPDLNILWLITGKGPMILDKNNIGHQQNGTINTIQGCPIHIDTNTEKEIALLKYEITQLKERIKDKEKIISMQEKIIDMQKKH